MMTVPSQKTLAHDVSPRVVRKSVRVIEPGCGFHTAGMDPVHTKSASKTHTIQIHDETYDIYPTPE